MADWNELADADHADGKPLLTTWLAKLRDNQLANRESLLEMPPTLSATSSSTSYATAMSIPIFVPHHAWDYLNVCIAQQVVQGSGAAKGYVRASIDSNNGTEFTVLTAGTSTQSGFTGVAIDSSWRGVAKTLLIEYKVDDALDSVQCAFRVLATQPDLVNGSFFSDTQLTGLT